MANKFDKILGEYRENDADGIITDHTALSNIGTNTHAQIDTFITANNPTTYFAGTMTVNSGTLISGTVTTLQTKDGTYVRVQEATGASPLTVTLDFTGLTTLDNLIFYGRYDGGTGHQVYVEMYNYTTASWDVLSILAHNTSDLWYTDAIVCSQCISGGAASIRFRHIQTGNTSHNLYLDYLAVRRGGSGGGGVTEHGSLTGLTDDDHTQYLKADGTRALTADWDAGSFEVRAQTLESDVATGTAPLTIASTTKVTNLNSDTLDGLHDTNFAKVTSAGTIYVATTGNDTTGDGTSGNPYLTIQKAISTINPIVTGNVTISVAAGSYRETVTLQGKNYSGNYTITIQGTYTATVSGTSSGSNANTALGSTATLNDTSKSWTVGTTLESGTTTSTTANKLVQTGQNFLTTVVAGMVVKNTTDDTWAMVTNVDSDTTLSLDTDIMVSGESFIIGEGQYKRYLVKITGGTGSGQIRPIYANTKTQLKIVGVWATLPDNTSTYDIYRPTTIITGSDDDATATRTNAVVVTGGQKNIVLDTLLITYATDTTLLIEQKSSVLLNNCIVTNGVNNTVKESQSYLDVTSCSFYSDTASFNSVVILRLTDQSIARLKYIYAENKSVSAVVPFAFSYVGMMYYYIWNNTTSTTAALNMNLSRGDISDGTICGCKNNGIYVGNGSYLRDNTSSFGVWGGVTRNNVITASTLDGVNVDGSIFDFSNANNTISNNKGWGVNANNLSIAKCSLITYSNNTSGTYTASAATYSIAT